MMSAPFKPFPIPPPSTADKARWHIPSIDELVQDAAKVEALFQGYYNQTTMLSGEAHNQRPIIVERFQRLLKILRNEHRSSSESDKKTIHKALESFLKSLEKVLPVSFSVQCDESDCSGGDAVRDAPRLSSGYFSPTLERITSNTHEPEKSRQISVEVDTSHKGGRPPKQWPPSSRRLLARFVTAAFPNLTFVQQALKQDGFAVRLVSSNSSLLSVLIRRSIRHIEGKVREMFGSRKPKDADFDSKLRPKDSAQMDNRVRAFMECKEQWHMLRKRAVLESRISVSSYTMQTDILDIYHDDQQALFVHPQENPPDETFQAEIQRLSTSRHEHLDPLDFTQTTLLDRGSLVSFIEGDTDVSMMEIGGLGELDLGSPSSLLPGGWRTSSGQGVNDMY